MDHEYYMRLALEDAAQAKAEGNAGVGSVIVRDSEIVARGRNLVTTTHDPTAHAETVAIRNAGEATGQVDFTGCTLYTTYEPCPMCCGAIMASGVSTVVMGGRTDPSESSWGSYTIENLIEMAGRGESLEVVTGVLTQACIDINR